MEPEVNPKVYDLSGEEKRLIHWLADRLGVMPRSSSEGCLMAVELGEGKNEWYSLMDFLTAIVMSGQVK
jgi:hypothetical protein